jgi:hypothetical protein
MNNIFKAMYGKAVGVLAADLLGDAASRQRVFEFETDLLPSVELPDGLSLARALWHLMFEDEIAMRQVCELYAEYRERSVLQ